MISAGNDIVSLSSIDIERTVQPNYYSKIISESELRYFESHTTGLKLEEFVWMAWAVKESSYKFLKRIIPELVFSPVKFNIEEIVPPPFSSDEVAGEQWIFSGEDEGLYSGKIKIGSQRLFFRAVKNSRWIASVVNDRESFDDTYWGVRGIETDLRPVQSARVREMVVAELKKIFSGRIEIRKEEGSYPCIFENGRLLNVPLSFSHHGNFVSFAFSMHGIMISTSPRPSALS